MEILMFYSCLINVEVLQRTLFISVMTTHKQQIQDVYNCLGTVSHLLKESHTGEEIDDFEDNFYSQQMQKASANGSMFPNTLHQVSNFLEKLSVQG